MGEIKIHDVTEKVLIDPRLREWGVSYTEYTKLGMKLGEHHFK